MVIKDMATTASIKDKMNQEALDACQEEIDEAWTHTHCMCDPPLYLPVLLCRLWQLKAEIDHLKNKEIIQILQQKGEIERKSNPNPNPDPNPNPNPNPKR